MSLTTRTLPQLFNGVSRQPAILRSVDQTEDELNTWAALSAGVGKRPPTETIAKISTTAGATDAFIHKINRDATERYVVVIKDGVIKVIGFDGVARTVNAPGGLGYLDSNDLTAVTVADYTFIINRQKQVTMKAVDADLTAPPTYLRDPRRTLIWDPNAAEWTRPGDPAQYDANTTPSTVFITGRVASVEKLPEGAPDGVIYEVQGSTENLYSAFYVKRNGDVWDETVKPGLRNAIDEATMPHCLIREGDGTFTFAPFSWAPRRAGDDDTNPLPTFVNRKLKDVFFYQNRLAFLVDENVILSCAGDFGNFWRNTVLDVIDSDVVDVAVTTAQVSILEHAILFNDGALLIADQTQFSLSNGENGVTPASMSVLPVTHYTVNKAARPQAMGTEVYFCGNTDNQTVVYEYSRLQDTEATTAADITAHVPGLIPANVKFLATGPRCLFAFLGDNRAWAYQLYWNGNEKLMSAWRPWTFSGSVLSATVIDDHLYLVVAYGNDLFLERLSLADGTKPASQPEQVYLDRRVELAGTYDAGTDRTTFVLPFTLTAAEQALAVVVAGNDAETPHQNMEGVEWSSGTTLSVPGQLTGLTSIGLEYDCFVELSQQFPTDYQGRPLTTGRLQMRTLSIRYTHSGRFDVEVYPYGRAPRSSLEATFPKRVVPFTGKVLGTDSAILGSPSYSTGSFRVALAGDSRKVVIRLVNNTYMASTFSSAEWEGLYNSRAMG